MRSLPACKGVWLDRGEIDKIIEIASSGDPAQSEISDLDQKRIASERTSHHREEHDDEHEHRDYTDRKTSQPRRRESWISDIFESFGGD
ncbi:zf-TFIIB domain-containing protein [bacterium]|nr:zf-TFIIB domain-containing protein [bacterium]